MHWQQIKEKHEKDVAERLAIVEIRRQLAAAAAEHGKKSEFPFLLTDDDLSMPHSFESDRSERIVIRRYPERKKPGKAMMAMALAVGTPVTAYGVSDFIEPLAKTTSSLLNHEFNAPLPPEISFCEKGMVFSGKKHDFVLTNDNTCKRLLQAIPGIGQTKHYNRSMSVTGLEDGSFSFRLKEDPAPIIVPRENYMAIIEAWLVSGGEKQDPVPLTFPFGKWRIESRLGTFIGEVGKKYCGMNQNGPAVLAQAFNEFGRDHGYDEERKSVRRIGAKYGDLDYGKVSRDVGFRAYFDQVCRNPVLSGVMGMRNSLKIVQRLQAKIDSGEIILPDGRERPSAADVYISHLLGVGQTVYAKDEKGRDTSVVRQRTGAVEFFHQLRANPDAQMKDYIDPDAYASNDYFLEEKIDAVRTTVDPVEGFIKREPVLDKDGNQVRITHRYSSKEFYQRFPERWGFDNRGFPNMTRWKAADYHPSGSAQARAQGGGGAEYYHPRKNVPELKVYTSDVKITYDI